MPKTIKPKAFKVYNLSELPKAARARAYEDYKSMRERDTDIPWQEETFDSLKAVINAAGLTLKDWDLGAYAYSHLKVSFPREEAADLKGARAMAWLENNLFGPLRNPWATATHRRKMNVLGVSWARGGMIDSCPLTGYCADDDYMDALRDAVKAGDTLKEAFEGLADGYCKLLEGELEYLASEEGFEVWAEGEQFLKDGRRYTGREE